MSFIAGLRCTVCRSPDLDFAQDVINCRRCGQQCPVLGGVPVMFETVSVHAGAAVAERAARQLLAAFDLPDDPVSLLHIRSLMRQRVLFGGALIQVESQQFLDRVRSSGHDISPVGADPVSHVQSGDPVPADLTVVPMTISVDTEIPGQVPEGWTLLNEPPTSYDADHQRGRQSE